MATQPPMPMPAEGDPPVCDQWTPGPGGAHPWCNTCGWRIDHHPNAPTALANRHRTRWATP